VEPLEKFQKKFTSTVYEPRFNNQRFFCEKKSKNSSLTYINNYKKADKRKIVKKKIYTVYIGIINDLGLD